VVPGDYEVRVTAGETVQTRSLEIRADPRVESTAAGYRDQHELMLEISGELEEIHEAVLNLRGIREQIDGLTNRLKEHEGHDSIVTVGEELSSHLTALEDSLVQNRTVDGQTVINFPSRLNFQYIYLRGAVDGAEGRVTDGARELLADLSQIWERHRATLDQLLGEELDAFNALVREQGVPAVVPH